ncbi:MAG: ComEC/Rec2 family competence protein [Clostridiales bacterium]|nr:ComEC/Rec2 family competence protein [Clostridiales bacterium]
MRRKSFVRPVAVIGMTFLSALLAASAFSLPVNIGVAAFCMIVALFTSLIKPLRTPKLAIVMITISIALGMLSIHTYFNYLPAIKLDKQQTTVTGTVTDLSVSEKGKQVVTVRLDHELTQTFRPVKIRLYPESSVAVQIADRISANTYCYLPSEQYGVYSPQDSAKADGIYLYGYVREGNLEVTPTDGFHLSRLLYQFRESLKQKADSLFSPESAGFIKAILLGDKSGLSDTDYRNFVHTGVVHLLTVSGLHFVILTQFVIRTLKVFHLKRKPRYAAGMAIILLFMGITGFQPAVNRAGLTLLLFYGAKLFNRDSDALTSLGLAGLLFALVNPYLVLDLGFQLTYLSTMGILLFSSKIQAFSVQKWKLKHPFWIWVSDMLSVTLSATITTLPVTAYSFQGFALLSPVWNILLAPLFTVILVLGLITLILAYIPYLSVIAEVLGELLTLCIKAINGITALGAKIPYSYLPLGYRFVYFWILATIILIFIAYRYCNIRFKYTLTALLSAVLLAAGTITHTIVYRDVLNVAVCTIGNDTAVLMNCQEQSILFHCNDLIVRLSDSNGIHSFPVVIENKSPVSLQKLSQYASLGAVITEETVAPDSIPCQQIIQPNNCDIGSGEQLQIKVRTRNDKVYYTVEYRNINIIYGEYDEHFESYYVDGKENIYILVKDCNMVFEKQVDYVIMLNGINDEMIANHPDVRIVDGTVQGITPVLMRKSGSVKIKGADKWLY